MKPIEILKKTCIFEKDTNVYVILAVARKKDNPLTNSNEVVFREVIKNEGDIERKYKKILGQVKSSNYNFYIYVTLNARDTVKGLFNLQNEINCWLKEYFNGVDISNKLKKVGGYWISNLMKPISRANRGKFLIDIDVKDLRSQNIERDVKKLTNVLLKVETKNGYHLVVEPFDISKMNKEDLFEIKRDAVLFIEHVVK